MTREHLPPRRQNRTVEIAFGEQTMVVSVGYYRNGRAGEVFADGHREGSAMQAFLDDACIIISVAIQYGITREALMQSLGRVPAHHDGQSTETWASPIGAILSAMDGA